MLPFKTEGFCDHSHGQGPEFLACPRDNRGRACSRSSSQTGGNENHVAALEGGFQVFKRFESRLCSGLGVGAGPQSLGDAGADLETDIGLRKIQGLLIGVGDNELDTLESVGHHRVDGITATTSDTDDLHYRNTL
jgi:hypothetical protein